MQVPITAVSLLSRCRDPSNHAAWRELDARYRELLIRFCRRRGVSIVESEDIVQNVFSSLVQTLPTFVYDPNRGRFRDYLFHCTRNAIIRWSRCPHQRQAALPPGSASDPMDVSASEPEDIDVWEQEWVAHHYRLALATVRREVEPRSIEVFERLLTGDSVVEVARHFGMTGSAVQKIRQRVRARMQELVVAQVDEEDRVHDVPTA